MATDDRSAAFSSFLSATAPREDREQEKLLEQLQRQAQQEGLAQGGRLLELFQVLPAAALASERAEYDRVVQRYGKDDPRAHALEQSLDALERAEAQAARGRARAARAMQAAQMPGAAFHGFVSDAAGEPLPGLTVRVASARLSAALEARSAQDGYFRVPLPDAAAKEGQEELGEVSILDGRGEPLHRDPMGLPLRAGSAWREYRVALERGPGAPGPKAAAPRARKKKHY